MKARTVLISGAGIAGPTLAYWLRRAGFLPTLLERAPAPRAGGHTIDFWGAGYDVAERMGLRDALHRDGVPVREVRFLDASGRLRARLDARALLPANRDRYVNLRRGDLARRLWGLVEGEVETLFGDTVEALDEDADGVTVRFARAAPRRFDLVVGADGLHSRVRDLAFGRDAAGLRYLGYCTAAFSAPGEPHHPRDDVYESFGTPGRQVARLPLPDGRTGYFLLYARDRRPDVRPHDPAGARRELRAAFAGAGRGADDALAALDRAEDLYFDAVAQVRLPRWSRGRTVLLGDAAACPSLLSGRGSSLAMAGAYLLARALADSGGDHVAAFARYERDLRPHAEAAGRGADRFGPWLAPRTALGLTLRNAALRALRLPGAAALIGSGAFRDSLRFPEEGPGARADGLGSAG